MSKSQTLRLSEVRRVFRLLGDVRELRHDQARQELLIVDTLVELLNADHGFALRFDGYRPGRPTRIEMAVPCSQQDPLMLRYLQDWGRRSSLDDDPNVVLTRPRARATVVSRMSGMMTPEQMRTWRIYEELWEHERLCDVLVAFFRYPRSDRVRGYAMHRTHGKVPYGRRDLRLARLFCDELLRLHRAGKLEPPPVVTSLPPRLRRPADLMLGGLSQKQIADEMGLSYQTVRSYSKQLYDMLGVHSREQLSERLRPGKLEG